MTGYGTYLVWPLALFLLFSLANGFQQTISRQAPQSMTTFWVNDESPMPVEEDTFLYTPYGGSPRFLSEPRYVAVASSVVRPGQVYRVAVTILSAPQPLFIRASILRENEEVSSASEKMVPGYTKMLLMQVPYNLGPGRYRVRVEGNVNGAMGGSSFLNETDVEFSPRFLTILIQTNQLVYNYGQSLNVRVVLLTTELKPFTDPVDVFLVDSRGFIMKRWVSVYPYIGFVSLGFKIPYDYPRGWWTVRVVALGQVEEKKVLLERWFVNRFDVNVSMPAFVIDTREYLEGVVTANFTSLAPVVGNLTIKAIVKPTNKRFITTGPEKELSLEKHIVMFFGTYKFRFRMSELRNLVAPMSLEGSDIEVVASVGERFINLVVTGYSRARVINSSLSFHFLGIAPQIFKPGMDFETTLAISYHDKVPLPPERLATSQVFVYSTVTNTRGGGFEVPTVNYTFDNIGTVRVRISIPRGATRLTLRAQYKDKYETARTELVALAFHSEKRRHLHVSTSTKDAKAGEYAIFHVRANFYMKAFHYLVVSKGIILLVSTEKVAGMVNSISTFSVALSPEMAPSCRVITYHVTQDGELLADSITLPVQGINRIGFELGINKKQDRSGSLIQLVPSLTTESIVGFSVTDLDFVVPQARNDLSPASAVEAMYKFEADRLKQQRVVWRDRRSNRQDVNYFVTSNYARDSNTTFVFAGLVVFTNMNITSFPQYCNDTAGQGMCMNGRCYPLRKRCDGVRDCDDGTDEGDCAQDDWDDPEMQDFHLHRRNRDDHFYESSGHDFAWRDVVMGNSDTEFVDAIVPKRPRVWNINAIAMSSEYGLAILDKPILFDGTRPFFITVESPLTAIVGEQIGLRVTVFNYQWFEIKAEVLLEDSPDYRFVQVEPFGIVKSYNPRTSRGQHQHLVYVKPYDYKVIYTPVVATRRGMVNITVTGRTQVAADRVKISINFLADGVPLSLHTSMLLDVRTVSYNLKFLDVNITEDPIIPYEDTYRLYVSGSPEARVSIIGDVVGAPILSSPIDGTDLNYARPVKSGEFIMFTFAYNLYTLIYLRLTNQLNPAFARKRLEDLNRAYVYQTHFYKDGAFTMFRREPSVWLTAYCARIFYLAQYPDWENYLYIDPEIIGNSVKFVLKHQTRDGAFEETTIHPWNRKMDPRSRRNGRSYVYRNVSLTAHVLITLAKVTELPGDLRGRVATAKSKAVMYLERQLPSLTDPYEVAIVTFALSEAGSVESEMGFNMLDKIKRVAEGMVYWSPEPIPAPRIVYQSQRPYIQARLPTKFDSTAVEATSYALMVYIRSGGIIQDQIVQWLNSMRRYDVGFITTQDTVVALQALIEYSFRTFVRSVTGMRVNVESSSNPGNTSEMIVHPNQLAILHTMNIEPNVWGFVNILARGSGMGILQMDVQYNVDRDFLLIQPPVPAFDLTVENRAHGRNKSHLNFRTCARWTLLEESPASGLAVIEIIVPTGYYMYRPDMDYYVRRGGVPQLRRGRVLPRSAIFMFDYLDQEWVCVNFTIERWYPVANLTRYLKAKVYDYYIPERYKEVIFEDYDLYVLNICEVCGSYQCPYCPYFSWAPRHTAHLVTLWWLLTVLHLLSNWLQEPG